MQELAWLFVGIGVLLVALALAWLILRLGRTLTAVEELLETTTEGLQVTLPEMRQTLGNVNDITAGVNVGLGVAARGASKAGSGVRSALYGARVAGQSLWQSYMDGSGMTGEAPAPRASRARRRGGSASGK